MKYGFRLLAFLAPLSICIELYAAPGDMDATYGVQGRTLIVSPIPGVHLQPNRFMQQADGKTVVIGWTEAPVGSIQDFAVVRLNTDGTLDTTFDGDGVVVINFGSLDQGIGIVEQPDGRLVVAGLMNGPPCPVNPCMALARLDSLGALDTSFDTDGKVVLTTPAATASVAIDIVLDASNNIVVGGHKSYADYIFLRLSTAGALDTTFNSTGTTPGVSIIDMGPNPVLMHRMIAQPDGKLVAVGSSAASATNHLHAIMRANADGTLDTSFSGGVITTPCAVQCPRSRVVRQSDGKLLIVGFDQLDPVASPPLRQQRSVLERRNSNGSLDSSFGTGGRVYELFRSLDPYDVSAGDTAAGVAVDTSGNITVVGRMTSVNYGSTATPVVSQFRTLIARYTSSGTPDASFGTGGLRYLPAFNGSPSQPYGTTWFNVNAQADGTVMVLGGAALSTGGSTTSTAMTVARLSNGPSHAGLLSATTFPATEESNSASVTVTRTGGASGAISVSYTTVPGTAQAGSDFAAMNGTLSWVDGDVRPKLLLIPLVRDNVPESSDEEFQFVLSSPTSGASLSRSHASVTIERDDLPYAVSVALAPQSLNAFEANGNLTFTVTRTGTNPIAVNYNTAWDAPSGSLARSPSDYTHTNGILIWGAGETAAKTITIPIVNDGISEPAETLTLAFLNLDTGISPLNTVSTIALHDGSPPQIAIGPSVTVNENQSAVVTVTRPGPTTATVAVNYTTAAGSAGDNVDFTPTTGTLTWVPGDADAKTITIPLNNDTAVESTETFTVTISNPTGGAILGASTATVTVIDNDTAPPPPGGGGGGGGGGTLSQLWIFALLSLLLYRLAATRAIKKSDSQIN